METYKAKISELVSRLKASNDHDSIFLIETMLKNCGAYIYKVNVLEAFLVVKPTEDGDEYRNRFVELDKQRSVEHNTLISSVKAVNRLCISTDLPLIFEGNVENRIEVAEFAMKIVLDFFSSRKL